MKVGIVGSGEVARALGTGFVATGHDVKLGTRSSPDANLQSWAQKSGPKGSVGTLSEAASFGDVVVLATLGVAVREAIPAAGVSNFDGKVVIDVTNPLRDGSDGMPDLAWTNGASNGESVQALLPKAHVVKAFNIIGNPHMFRPTFPGGPPDMFIAGNDAEAKKKVAEILKEFGWPSVIDIGGIERARQLESLCILWVRSAIALQNFDVGFKLLRK
jgi:8-hydroxy-5-deazaflavin:NADPH oxidoreductase